MHNVNIQYLTDAEGNKKAVMIPIEEWEQMEKQYMAFIEYTALKSSLSTAFMEVREMIKGNKKGKSAKEFLDEL